MAPPYTSIMMSGAGAIGQTESDPWAGVQYYYDGSPRAVGGVSTHDNQAGTGGLSDYANRAVPTHTGVIGNGYQIGNPTPDNFSPSAGQNMGTIPAQSDRRAPSQEKGIVEVHLYENTQSSPNRS